MAFTQDRATPLLRSRSSTIQFLVVALMMVFKDFPQERVRQQVQSRPFTFQFRTVAGTSFILLQQRIFKICGTRQIMGFFRTFPRYKKSAKIPRTQRCESARECQLMASMDLAGVRGRVTRRWLWCPRCGCSSSWRRGGGALSDQPSATGYGD